MAEEVGVELGREVGWSVRFTDRTRAETKLRVMTDGILLAEAQRDRHFSRYDTIIVDEAHERSLNIDFLLGLPDAFGKNDQASRHCDQRDHRPAANGSTFRWRAGGHWRGERIPSRFAGVPAPNKMLL